MTSSLVGSEMCIRDRPRGISHRRPGVVSQRRPAMVSQRWPVGSLVTSAAVSYTHLTLPTICSV
eukprot:7808100-Prorocentrum_lima.AAC.1